MAECKPTRGSGSRIVLADLKREKRHGKGSEREIGKVRT